MVKESKTFPWSSSIFWLTFYLILFTDYPSVISKTSFQEENLEKL